MILGTSKNWSKSGPGDLLIITKMLQKIQEKLWNHPGKILYLSIWVIKKSKIFEICMSWVPDFCFDYFRFLFLHFVSFLLSTFLVFFCIYILKIILQRWGIENDTFFIIKQRPNLDLNFISIKKHETIFTLNFVFSRNVP